MSTSTYHKAMGQAPRTKAQLEAERETLRQARVKKAQTLQAAGYTLKQIGRSLGLTHSAVSILLKRAR